MDFCQALLNICWSEVTGHHLSAVHCAFFSDNHVDLLPSRSQREIQHPRSGCEIQAAGSERQPDAGAQLQVGFRKSEGGWNLRPVGKTPKMFQHKQVSWYAWSHVLLRLPSVCVRKDTWSVLLLQCRGNTQSPAAYTVFLLLLDLGNKYTDVDSIHPFIRIPCHSFLFRSTQLYL